MGDVHLLTSSQVKLEAQSDGQVVRKVVLIPLPFTLIRCSEVSDLGPVRELFSRAIVAMNVCLKHY